VKTPVVLLSALVLLPLWRYHGVLEDRHGPMDSCYFQFVFFFAIVGVLPLLYARAIGTRLSELGVGVGDARFGAKLVLLLIPIMVLPVTYVASGMADVRAEYPMCRALYSRRDLVIWYELAYVALFYTAWEFYFRGFMLFGLKSQLGATNAIVIQTMASSLLHIGKPAGEILGSIPIGLLFGLLALRTRSIWYGWAVHASIGVLTDLFILGRA
jgi:membrane protease YdiL (CAAX protease family)